MASCGFRTPPERPRASERDIRCADSAHSTARVSGTRHHPRRLRSASAAALTPPCMDQPPARSAPPDNLAQSTDRHLVPERVDQARSIPPDRNSRRPNPLESDGGKPLLATLNTYRRENTPQNTRDEAGEQPPPPAEYPQSDGPEL